jgi:hypothetical protein
MSYASRLKDLLLEGTTDGPLPRLELMPYHPQTLERWRGEGLPQSVVTQAELHDYFGLVPLEFFFIWPDVEGMQCAGKVATAEDFTALKAGLYDLGKVRARMEEYRRTLEAVQARDGILWIPLHGFFWHPRDLFGIAPHLMMFYDQPALMRDVNAALLEFNIAVVRMIYEAGLPAVICVSEDMAAKGGSMISRAMFDDFMAPYHRALAAEIRTAPVVAAVDCDGDISDVAGWMAEVGIMCTSPLERQNGMDLAALRDNNPTLALMGGFDKRCMSRGAAAIEAHFESLKPLFRRGRFLPAVDHQTPPEVSLENYRHYLKASAGFFDERGGHDGLSL